MQALFDDYKNIFKKAKITETPAVKVEVKLDDFVGTVAYMKDHGFNQLTLYTAVDWIKEGNFELVAILYDTSYLREVYIKTFIKRTEPRIETIKDFYPQAMTYEREMHEMFGIEFLGNENLTEFILANWQFAPPLRKDFDTRQFVKDYYEVEDDISEKEYINRQIKYGRFEYHERG